MLTRSLVGLLGKATKKIFEDCPHLVVIDAARAEVDLVELLDHLVQDVATLEPLKLLGKVKLCDDILNVFTVAIDVVLEVFGDVRWLVEQCVKVELRSIVKSILVVARRIGATSVLPLN